MTKQRRAIGIIRKSKGHEGASPVQQRESIERECKRLGLKLVEVHEELEVKGGTPLAKRKGLLAAIEAVEGGKADVVLAAYFDRLMRSLTVQAELVSRVEAAGGEVLAVDIGQVTRKDASKKLSGNLLGAVAEYHADMTRERAGDAQRRAVERGVVPWPNIPAGYRRGDDGVLLPHAAEATAIATMFELRADGATVKDCRAHLVDHGIKRTWACVQAMLKSRVYRGEINFGELVNLTAHPAIIDADVWARAQRTEIRGPRPKSERLLARLGVLRCASCGGRLTVASQTKRGRGGQTYHFYCCRPTSDCDARVAISATMVEEVVVKHVREALADVEGRASAEDGARKAEQELAGAQQALDAAVRAFDVLGDVESARERLRELRAAVDDAQARVDQLGDDDGVLIIGADRDWDRLTLDEQRALIRAVVSEVTVGPGRGAERITITLAG
jgi:site-specific DNA recombinase